MHFGRCEPQNIVENIDVNGPSIMRSSNIIENITRKKKDITYGSNIKVIGRVNQLVP